jgi:hypothetical protein
MNEQTAIEWVRGKVRRSRLKKAGPELLQALEGLLAARDQIDDDGAIPEALRDCELWRRARCAVWKAKPDGPS